MMPENIGLGVAAAHRQSAEDELLHYLRYPFNSEPSIYDSVPIFVLIGEVLKVFFEQQLDGAYSTRIVDRLLDRGELEG